MDTPFDLPHVGRNLGRVPRNTEIRTDHQRSGDPIASTTEDYVPRIHHLHQVAKKVEKKIKIAHGLFTKKIDCVRKLNGGGRPNVLPLFTQSPRTKIGDREMGRWCKILYNRPTCGIADGVIAHILRNSHAADTEKGAGDFLESKFH